MIGLRVGSEIFEDGGKVIIHLRDDIFEFGVISASKELATKRHEQGNLKLDLAGVRAVENTVESGVGEGRIKLFGEGGLVSNGGFFGGERVFGGFIALEVGGKLIGGIGERTRESGTDGAQAGRFELLIIGLDGGLEIGRAKVNLAGEIAGFARGGTDHVADNHEGDESEDSAGNDFDDELDKSGTIIGNGGLGRAGGLRDLIKISEIVHGNIIA